MSISCFLIDMKFISKLLEMFLWKIYHFPILIFTNLYTKYLLIFQETTKNRETKTKHVSLPFNKSKIFRFSDMILFKGCPHHFLDFVEVFW